MKFFETMTNKDVALFGSRQDPKRKNQYFKHLKAKFHCTEFRPMEQITAYMKKEYGLNVAQSDIIKIAVAELIDELENPDDFIELLNKYNKLS